ncbi:lantibiotic protection ABC transporter ATP-binding protein [Clostridium oryzae]|uniref:Putative ABC transporter ATP-binding protein YxlF n=1 Tax=Clostridium oryzae TaxID=1450648 RepID=A0A1V4IGQ6_9CLOT|nr:lantibiotic protection ABC transporter ATP-binding protein [Clostridium oryzae]OPJ59172.1 putative ABC transporter ATP-binding protein YxlF [Clostridium oryzae]
MDKYILETKALNKYFGKQLAVNNISLKVREGSIYGLLGPNGAGKSTTLKTITGLLHATRGEILIDGNKWNRKQLENIGALIEAPAIYGNLSARDNLRVHTKLMNIPESRIDEVLKIVDLTDTGKKKSSQFSLGMKQRLGIAIALLGKPKLLILDEPTNGLDPIGIQELRALIKSFPKQGITVIISSHILSEVQHTAEYVGIINNGQLKYEGKIDENIDLESLFMKVVMGDSRGGSTLNA